MASVAAAHAMHELSNNTKLAWYWLWYGLQFYLYVALARMALCGIGLFLLYITSGSLSRYGFVIAVIVIVSFLFGYVLMGARAWVWSRRGAARIPDSFSGWALWASVVMFIMFVVANLATALQEVLPIAIIYGALLLLLMLYVEGTDFRRACAPQG